MTAPVPAQVERLERAVKAAQRGDLDAVAEVEAADDWHLTRRTGLGGSDVAALLGLDRWKRPIDVWLVKTGRQSDDAAPESEPARWGKLLEPVVAEDYAATHKVRLVGPLPAMRHPDRSWHLGNIDRAVPVVLGAGYTRIVEIKTRGWHRLREYGLADTDEVPLAEQCQARWYMPLARVDRADVAVLFNTSHRRDYVLERDDTIEQGLVESCEQWWRDHVLADVAPDADGSDSYGRYLADRFDADAGYAVPTEHDLELLGQARALAVLSRSVRDARELVQQRIGQRIGEAAGWDLAPFGDAKLHYKAQRGRPDDSSVMRELAERLGIGERQLEALRSQHRHKPSRPMRFPVSWRSDELVGVLPELATAITQLTEPSKCP